MIKHIYPLRDSKNGVYLYGKYIDRLIENITSTDGKDIIHCELGYTGHREFWLLKNEMKMNKHAKFIITLHDPPIIVGKPFKEFIRSEFFFQRIIRKLLDEFVGKKLISQILKKSDILFLINRKSLDIVSEYYKIDKIHLKYLPHPVMIEAKKSFGSSKYNSDILFFGNIDPRKGVDILLDALSRLTNNKINKNEMIIKIIGSSAGNNNYLKSLQKIASKEKLVNIEFTGFVEDDELVKYIKNTKVITLPYRDSGIIHASGPMFISMGLGTPVIASDLPTFNSDIKDGNNGLLFQEGNALQLADKIDLILSDSKIYKSISKNSKEYVKLNNSDSVILEKLKKVYKEV